MQTRRAYLADLNPPLAIPGARGRISKPGLAAIARAEEEGIQFSDGPAVKTDPELLVPNPGPVVYPPIYSNPVIRDIKHVSGFTPEGYLVQTGICSRCSSHVSRCPCSSGIKAPSIVVEWSEDSKPYGSPIDQPARA